MAKKISKAEFDRLAEERAFSKGPFVEHLEKEYGGPYQPYRHLRGTLFNGVEVESSTDPGWMQEELPQSIDLLMATEESLKLLIANRGWTNVLNSLAAIARDQQKEAGEGPTMTYYASLAARLSSIVDWFYIGVIGWECISSQVRKALDPVMYAVVSRSKTKERIGDD